MLDLEVIDDPATAVVALDPVRARLLAELVEPGSAASLAPRMGLARQKVNYHLRALEAHGLVRPVEKTTVGGTGRAPAGRHRRVVRRLASGARGIGERPRPGVGPAVRPLPDCARGSSGA